VKRFYIDITLFTQISTDDTYKLAMGANMMVKGTLFKNKWQSVCVIMSYAN